MWTGKNSKFWFSWMKMGSLDGNGGEQILEIQLLREWFGNDMWAQDFCQWSWNYLLRRSSSVSKGCSNRIVQQVIQFNDIQRYFVRSQRDSLRLLKSEVWVATQHWSWDLYNWIRILNAVACQPSSLHHCCEYLWMFSGPRGWDVWCIVVSFICLDTQLVT